MTQVWERGDNHFVEHVIVTQHCVFVLNSYSFVDVWAAVLRPGCLNGVARTLKMGLTKAEALHILGLEDGNIPVRLNTPQ